MEVILTDKYVNNQNEKAVKSSLKINKELETAIKAGLYVVKADGTTEQLKTDADSGSEVVVTVRNHTSLMAMPTFDVSKLDDGIHTIRLISNDGEMLAEFTIDKHTEEIEKAKIVALKGSRPASTKGTVSFEVQSESKIVKAYYKLVEYKDVAAGTPGDNVPKTADYDAKTPYIEVTDNKVTDAELQVVSKKAYDVYFKLEDEYGSIATNVANSSDDSSNKVCAVIPTDETIDEAKTVVSVTMPDLTKVSALGDAKITWTLEEGETVGSTDKFMVILYKDGEVVGSTEVTNATEVALDQFGISALEAGNYQASVFGEGDANTLASETVTSNTVTVTALNSVSNVTLNIDMDGKAVLSWDSSYAQADIKGYKVEIAEYNQTTKGYEDTDYSAKCNTDVTPVAEKELDVSAAISTGKLYKARVSVVAKDGHKLSEVDSEPIASKEFFKIATPTIVNNSTTASTATLQIPDGEVKISGKTATYQVEVYTVNTSDASGKTESKYTKVSELTQNVKVNTATGKFEVAGLSQAALYAIRLVGSVDGITGTSQFVELEKTKSNMPVIQNKTKVSTTPTKSGEIAVTSDGVSIDGVDYKLADYPAELQKVQNIVNALKDGDIINNYTSDVLDLTIGTRVEATRTFPADVKDMVINITGNDFNQVLKTTAGSEPAEINITGKLGQLNIANVVAERIVLNDNTSVITAAVPQSVIISEGATVTFYGGLTVTTSEETEVSIDRAQAEIPLIITPNSANNEITVNSSKAIKVSFNGDDSVLDTQDGKLTIESRGNITVEANNMNLASDIDITVTNGNVDLSGANLSGTQAVTITSNGAASHTVKVKAADAAPYTLAATVYNSASPLEMREYSYDELTESASDVNLKTALKTVLELTGEEDESEVKARLATLNTYIKSFGLTQVNAKTGKSEAIGGATLTANKDEKDVTITFAKKLTGIQITGLQK